MKPVVKKILLGVVGVLGVCALGASAFVYSQTRAFDASMDKTYDIPLPDVKASTDPAVIARGKHLAESLAACATKDCHGADLAGGNTLQMGPVGTFTGPNITPKGISAAYSDGELARLIRYGVKKDGKSVRFMVVQDFNWLPDDEIAAIVSYVRTAPGIDKANGPNAVGVLGKVLDRKDVFFADVARLVAGRKIELAPKPSPTAEYGKYLAKTCSGCHGEHYSGGHIPGTPKSFPDPLNLTPHETGLKGWTYEDFTKLLNTGMRKNGKQLHPFMPIEATAKADDTEKQALWAYLSSLAPLPYGGR
ncbi:MAG: c-type cytochrome [Polyangiales bacterium]